MALRADLDAVLLALFLTGADRSLCALLDMQAAYRFAPGTEVYLRGENLTNARYQEIKDYGVTGRAIYAGIKSNF